MGSISKIEIVTGFTCNNNCMFCSVGDKLRTYDKTTEEVMLDIDRACGENPSEINLTGGEPTMRKDFFRLLSHARERGIPQIRVTTNGRLFSYSGFAKEAVRAGLTGAIVSYHTHDRNLHDSLSRVRGSFVQTSAGLKNLVSAGLVIDINTVLTSESVSSLPETMESINGVRSVCIIFPTIDGHMRKNMGLVPRMSECRESIHSAIDVLESKGIQSWVLNYPLCFMQGHENCSSMMSMNTKMFWPGKDTNLDRKRKGDNAHVPVCGKCMYRECCPGVMKGYLEAFGDSEIEPVREAAKGGAYPNG